VLFAGDEARLLRGGASGSMRLPMTTTAVASTTDAAPAELRDRLLAFIARRVRTREDAEDVFQEVMLRIHRHSDDLEDVDRVTAWIYRIASNAIVDHYRRPSRRELPSGQGADVPEPDATAPPPSVAEVGPSELRQELAACLAPMIERLSPIYREALETTELGGLTQTEAAARIGISVSGMKARVQRARSQLRAQLLACCQVELDARGGVTDVRARRGSCGNCAPQAETDR
jgi:RNA polymerase sigma-70 factor (ECF subfamily)